MFSHRRTWADYAALVDIGSGSVTVSVIYNGTKRADSIEFLWTHQERLRLKDTQAEGGGKPLLSALLNAMLALGSDGQVALRAHNPHGVIKTLQVSVSAPWSYTITKRVNLHKDEEFTLTEDLVKDLLLTAEKKTTNDITENEVARSLELDIATKALLEIRANDYIVPSVSTQRAHSLHLATASVIVQTYLLEAITEVQQKVLPGAELQLFSAILQFYLVLRESHPEMSEYCLVSVTLEATEIGIVRDGVLTFTTHEPTGIVSLAREIAAITETPVSEVYGQLSGTTWQDYSKSTPAATAAKLDTVFKTYIDKVASLFLQTGDDFTVPKTIYLHSAGYTHDVFSSLIDHGAENATGLKHIVHDIDQELQNVLQDKPEKTTIQHISGTFFHTYGNDSRFTFL